MPRRVLYLIDGLGLSGKTRTMAYLATHLDSTRYQGTVCTLTPGRTALSDQLAERGVDVHEIPCRDGLDLTAVGRVAGLIRRTGAEFVHCYNPRPILYGGLAASLAGVRSRVGSLSAFACQVPDRSYGFLPQQLVTRSRRNVYRNRFCARLMRYLVTVSEGLGQRFFEYNALPPEKLRVVSYGADLGAVERVSDADAARMRQELGFTREQIVLGSVGRLVEQKDYPTQLRAFAAAAARVPGLRMVLAGDGPLESSLRALVGELGVTDRVRFLGHWEQVPLLLRSLDVFVMASKFEPYGVALVEAKAAGLPIVSTRVNEIPEIVTHGVSGLLVEAEQPEAMAEAFVGLAVNPSLRTALGQRALVEARERHSLQSVVAAYQDLYDACAR